MSSNVSITNDRGFVPAKLPDARKTQMARVSKWLDKECRKHWPHNTMTHRHCLDCMVDLHDKKETHNIYLWLKSPCTDHWTSPYLRRMDCFECVMELGESHE